MNADTVQALLHLNRQFYQTFALQFSADRQRLQPGVQRLLAQLPLEARLLDLGCGNGELARALAQRGQRGAYAGLDFSPALVAIARQKVSEAVQGLPFQCLFFEADLAGPQWEILLRSAPHPQLPRALAPFDAALAFAVLHHLPGRELRRQVLHTVHALLIPDGRFVHSVWQFLNSPRLRARIQPWESAGIPPEAVDPGDTLLDWRHGGYGLRYVHHFSEDELTGLADETGFSVQETFLSDGESGRLGLYQVWERREA